MYTAPYLRWLSCLRNAISQKMFMRKARHRPSIFLYHNSNFPLHIAIVLYAVVCGPLKTYFQSVFQIRLQFPRPSRPGFVDSAGGWPFRRLLPERGDGQPLPLRNVPRTTRGTGRQQPRRRLRVVRKQNLAHISKQVSQDFLLGFRKN